DRGTLPPPGGHAPGIRDDRAGDAPAHDRHRQRHDEVGGAAMPARTGEQYIQGLQQQEREVWLGGERVKDVTTHPGLANGVRAIAPPYQMQPHPTLRDERTDGSPTTADRGALSFLA